MIKIVKDTQEARARFSAPRWLARVVLLLAVLAMVPFFAAITGQAKAAAFLHTGMALGSAEISAALGAEAVTAPSLRALGCSEQTPRQTGSGHSGSCAQHCGAGCSLALVEAGNRLPVFPVASRLIPWGGMIIGSLDPQPDFRPPRFVP